MTALTLAGIVGLGGMLLAAPRPASPPDTAGLLSGYVDRFNSQDDELYTNAIPNSAAKTFLLANAPRFACPDKEIERTYYFRWWTFRKHLRHDLGLWTVTEFMPDVGWAGVGNTIVCPAGHHLREGRWLRDAKYIADDARFWLADTRASHRWGYSSWLFTGTCGVADVTGADELPVELLDAAIAYYERWEKGFERGKDEKGRSLRQGGDGLGGFLSVDNYEGTEISLGGSGYKPLMASAMWSEALAISRIAAQAERKELSECFAAKAATVRASVLSNCWNEAIGFFTTATEDGVKGSIRELHGYAPWYFGMPTGHRRPDWRQLSDPMGFSGKFGLTFPERRAPGFRISYEGHACQWNGPSWPFATSVALTALANDLHSSSASATGGLFVALLRQYAAQQVLTRTDGTVVPWIDENQNPDTGDWIARTLGIRRQWATRERGKDYNHSTFCDLVISGLVGIVPNGRKGFAVDPLFPAEWDYLVLENLRYRGHDVAVCWRRGFGFSVEVDGRETVRRPLPERVDVNL